MKTDKAKAFGASSSLQQADLALLPVPWEASASYGRGAGKGPDLIRKASFQMDFFNLSFKKAYNHQIYFANTDPFVESLNKEAQEKAAEIQENWEENKTLNEREKVLCAQVNQASRRLLDWLYEKSAEFLKEGKIPALAGGDHSISEGLLRLMGERLSGGYGILHIDAHADLRDSYQGFKHSHASIMRNVLNLPHPPKKLVQVGVRDLSEEEHSLIQSDSRIECFFDEEIQARLFSGGSWAEICSQIVSALPVEVYVSLDVDGLSWECAPGTGAPVPGGLSFQQARYLLYEMKRQKKKLIAFDVVESSSGGLDRGGLSAAFQEWNGNVSARLIYDLAGLALFSAGRLK